MKLDEEYSAKELSYYMKKNVEDGSLVKNIIFFADDNRDYTIQSMWIYYQSPSGENKTLKLAVSEKENSIIDSIAAGKSPLAYDTICWKRENSLMF